MSDSYAELVFGFVYAVGTNPDPVVSLLKDYLNQYEYACHEFRVSEHLRTLDLGITFDPRSVFAEMNALMDAGNEARKRADAANILSIMAVNDIADKRDYDEEGKPRPSERIAHVIRSLKTPDEVRLLREVYRPGFFLIGIASDDDEQHEYLTKIKGLSDSQAATVIQRDQDEKIEYGQRTRDTFYLADVFVELSGERYKSQLDRFLEVVFAHPFRTPTREEHAMFMAYSSAARSAQLGRQVGASIATVDGEVIAVGFNEVPQPGGGPYWEGDQPDERDHNYAEKIDSNYLHRARMIDNIVEALRAYLPTQQYVQELLQAAMGTSSSGVVQSPQRNVDSKRFESALEAVSAFVTTIDQIKKTLHSTDLKEITEYGRAVHAEMDALLTCARLGISVKGMRLFTTTFPCHNCTRHVIAAGIASVTYIEPYPKSRAAALPQRRNLL